MVVIVHFGVCLNWVSGCEFLCMGIKVGDMCLYLCVPVYLSGWVIGCPCRTLHWAVVATKYN